MRAKTPRTSLNKLSSLNVGAVKIEDTIHYNGAKWLTIHLIKIYMDKKIPLNDILYQTARGD